MVKFFQYLIQVLERAPRPKEFFQVLHRELGAKHEDEPDAPAGERNVGFLDAKTSKILEKIALRAPGMTTQDQQNSTHLAHGPLAR